MITHDWAAPFRATRLHEMLAAARGVGLDEMGRLQNDLKSLAAARLMAGVPQALETAKKQDAEAVAVDALTELAAWDQVVDGRAVVTLYEAFEDAVWRRTFVDEMGDPLFRVFYQWAGGERPAGLYAVVDERQSRWFDDIATIEKRESRDDIYILAARDAAERVEAEYGRGSGRAWDRVHAITFEHPLAAGSWWRSWVFSRGPVPIAGDGTTIMRVSWNRLRPFRGVGGAVLAPAAGRGRVGPGARGPADGPVGSPAEPALLRPERALALGPVPDPTLLTRGGAEGAEPQIGADALRVSSQRCQRICSDLVSW